MSHSTRTRARLIGSGAFALATSFFVGSAQAGTTPAPAVAAVDDQSRDPSRRTDIAEGSDIVVTATRANELAPVTASLATTQPQAIVSRSFIEDSLPATAERLMAKPAYLAAFDAARRELIAAGIAAR